MAEMALERPHFNNLELFERLGCEFVTKNYMVSMNTLAGGAFFHITMVSYLKHKESTMLNAMFLNGQTCLLGGFA